MIELVLESAAEFKKCVDAISVLIDEAEFVIDEHALSLKATDPSQISMVNFQMEKKAFKHFKAEATTKIGLDMNYLAQVMARAKPSDELTLALDEKASKLGLTFKGASRRSFSIPLIDISSSELPNPKIDFDATIKMKAEILQDGLKDAVLISSHILLGVSDKSFFLKANSSKGELDSETGSKEKGILDFSAKKECKSMFPLDYLSDMLKVAASDTPIEVNLKNNAPARISYAIGKASITYFLAPRIESE